MDPAASKSNGLCSDTDVSATRHGETGPVHLCGTTLSIIAFNSFYCIIRYGLMD
jgi:hypothetical protein